MINATVREVGPGCFVWLRLPGRWGETNIGLVTGDRAALLIDTPWDQRLAREMLDAFAPHTATAPITQLFNTHPDVDHWWGNAELPGAEIVASVACAEAMRAEATPEKMLAMRRFASLSGRIPGRAGRVGRYVGSMLAPFALDEVKLRFPDRTFTERRTEMIGGRELQLIDFGSAHTVSDSVVVVPDARVVFTGDLLFNRVTPVMWHGPVSGWLDALTSLMALDADVFVAGHGPVGTRAELQALHDYWTWLTDAVRTGRAAGRGTLELATRLSAAAEFTAYRGWENPERLYVNVATLERELQGLGPIPASPVARAKAFDGVAALAAQLTR